MHVSSTIGSSAIILIGSSVCVNVSTSGSRLACSCSQRCALVLCLLMAFAIGRCEMRPVLIKQLNSPHGSGAELERLLRKLPHELLREWHAKFLFNQTATGALTLTQLHHSFLKGSSPSIRLKGVLDPCHLLC